MLKRMLFAAVLVIGLLSVSYAQENNAKKFAGVWVGTIDMGGQTMTVIFKLQEKEGKLSGTGESPEQGGGALTLENITVTGNKLQFEITAVQAGFDGVYKEDKKNIDGTLVINQQGIPLLLTKDEKAVIEPEKKFDSFWEGTLSVMGTNLRLVIKTFIKPDGSIGGLMDSPDQGVNNIEITTLSLTAEELKFEISSLTASFTGKIDKASMTAKGTFSQGGQEIPLEMKKVDKPAEKK